MSNEISKLEAGRRKGEHQVDDQRTNILDAAQKLFLEQGLDNTSMTDVAAEASINRVSLYRYFPDLHHIAFEIAARMLHQIYESINVTEDDSDFELARKMIMTSISQFYDLRDAYRYLGMFDHLYGAGYPTEELAAWYKEQVAVNMFNTQDGADDIEPEQIVMVGNCVMSFLQKLAVRGDLMAEEQGVSLDSQLALLNDMIDGYFDRLAAANELPPR